MRSLLLGLAVCGIAAGPANICSAQAKQDVTTADVFKIWKARADRLPTVRIKWEDKRTDHAGAIVHKGILQPARDTTYRNAQTLLISGERIKYSVTGMALSGPEFTIKPRTYESSFNGKVNTYFYDAGGITDYPSARVTDDKRLLESRSVHLAPVIWWLGRELGSVEDGNVALSKEAVRHAGRTYRVIENWAGIPIRTYWCDPERDWVIVRAATSKQGALVKWQLDIDYLEHDKFGFIPSDWTFTCLGNAGQPRGITIASRMTSVTIGDKFGDRDFDTEFPLGTLVNDAIKNRFYVVLLNNEQRELKREERIRGYEQAIGAIPANVGWRLVSLALALPQQFATSRIAPLISTACNLATVAKRVFQEPPFLSLELARRLYAIVWREWQISVASRTT